MSNFSSRLISWQRVHGRHDLPWQLADAYGVWLSEIMLQQTQVVTVIPYYLRFVEAFPDVVTLAAASQQQVLEHWSGLGYYARGRNLHRAAQVIVEQYGGRFPDQFEQILGLPGIGRSTAAAICAQAYHQRHAILDGNVKRVLARYCGIEGLPSSKSVETQLWQQAEALLPRNDVAVYTQALMDMGATLCTRSKPKCDLCPVRENCMALQSGRVDELPTSRSRKPLIEKHAVFVIAINGRDIFLEKRAPTGIWGGLMCFPQLDGGKDELAAYVKRMGWHYVDPQELPVLLHTFSHFRLKITPLLLRLEDKPLVVRQGSDIWLDVNEACSAAIPTPVRVLLERLGSIEAVIRSPCAI